VNRMKHHPVADLFPMLTDDELAEMAADIRERGQLQPIMLDKDGRILDGRNRYAACGLAGVDPVFETYDGDDPDGYALAVNINRRHLTKGQQAMIVAKSGVKYKNYTEGPSKQYIAHANVVHAYANELEDSVIAGAKPLSEIYDIARRRKQDGSSDTAKLAQVRDAYPELADKVTDGELSLQAALEEVRQRQSKQRQVTEVAGRVAQSFLSRLQADAAALVASREQGDEPWFDANTVKAARAVIDLLEDQAL